MAEPDTLRIPYESFEYGRFTHVGQYGDGNQFLGFTTYAFPKFYHTEEVTSDGQLLFREHTNCFAVLHRFDAEGRHQGTDVERLEGTEESSERDWAKFELMLARLGNIQLGDIYAKPFRVESEGIVHGLIYKCVDCEDPDEPGSTDEYVMLQPNDIMFHRPWDSGSYST